MLFIISSLPYGQIIHSSNTSQASPIDTSSLSSSNSSLNLSSSSIMGGAGVNHTYVAAAAGSATLRGGSLNTVAATVTTSINRYTGSSSATTTGQQQGPITTSISPTAVPSVATAVATGPVIRPTATSIPTPTAAATTLLRKPGANVGVVTSSGC